MSNKYISFGFNHDVEHRCSPQIFSMSLFLLLPAASAVAIAAFLCVINYFMYLLYKEMYLP
jgi:hypothetical protein